MEPKRIFAADIGASGGKCFLGIFEKDSFNMVELHRFFHETSSFYIKDRSRSISERIFWDDQLIYSNILKGLQIFRREITEKLDGIGIDTWGTDGHFITSDGDLLGKVYCYRDHRLDSMIQILKQKIDPDRIYEITGIHFWPFNISNQLLWFIMNRNKLLPVVEIFLPMPSIFTFFLGNVKMIDTTWASVTQLMDARQKKWSLEILQKLGIPERIMPKIVSPGTIMGKLTLPLTRSLKINQAPIVAVGSHDTASAFAAAPVEDIDTSLIISSGTWSLVGKLIPEPITTKEAKAFNFSNEGGIGNIRFLKNCMGSWLIQELRKIWKVEDGREMSWDEIVGLVHKATPFSGYIDPDDPTFYNPHNMEDAIKEYLKKSRQNVPEQRGNLLRIVYESLALKYRIVNEAITKVTGKKNNNVHIIGGGSKNELLNQFTSDATGLKVIAGPEEATALGNIMVQALGLGIISSLEKGQDLIKKTFSIREYMPQKHDLWDRAYEKYRKIIKNYH